MIWLGNLEWCICIVKRKSGFLRQVFVFYSVANVGDFCSFKGYADRPEIQKFIKNDILHFPSNEMQICNYLGSGFNIPGYKGNKFFDPKSMVGSYGDALLNTSFCRHFDIRMYEIKWRKCVEQKFGIKDFIIFRYIGISWGKYRLYWYSTIPCWPDLKAKRVRLNTKLSDYTRLIRPTLGGFDFSFNEW